MLSTHLRILSASSSCQCRGRFLRTTLILSSTNSNAKGKDPSLSQGLVTNSTKSAQYDPATQSPPSGLDKNRSGGSGSTSQTDPASPDLVRAGKGNPEKVGFSEQIGSASSNVNAHKGTQKDKKNESEEATPSGFFGTLKKMMKMWSERVKESKGGATVVSGTDSTPPDSTRYVGRSKEKGPHSDVGPTVKQTTETPKTEGNNTFKDQNSHLPHKREREKNSGNGYAADEPVLPSQRKERKSEDEDVVKRFPSGARG